ncbi:MAG: hypothetical protein GY748_05170, partial [Planctomycetaceae bacterium]|nr:hypothetical protein [Planctomycetaceae bacterium]
MKAYFDLKMTGSTLAAGVNYRADHEKACRDLGTNYTRRAMEAYKIYMNLDPEIRNLFVPKELKPEKVWEQMQQKIDKLQTSKEVRTASITSVNPSSASVSNQQQNSQNSRTIPVQQEQQQCHNCQQTGHIARNCRVTVCTSCRDNNWGPFVGHTVQNCRKSIQQGLQRDRIPPS